MIIQTDARRRITLPTHSGVRAGDVLEVEILEDGRILLVPIEAVPRHQLWAWTKDVKEAVVASLSDPRPSQCIDTDAQLKALTDRWSHED